MDMLLPIVTEFMAKWPVLGTIIFVVGVLRLIMKPVVSTLHAIADSTATDKDNLKLAEMESSKIYTTLCFVLDWITSLKFGPQAK